MIEAVIAFIYGLIYVVAMGAIMSSMPFAAQEVGIMGGIGIGVLAIILFPIIGFIGGFIVSAIFAILYNVLAPRVGGIKLELE